MAYKKRQLAKIIEEICIEKKIKLKEYSDDWILELSKGTKKFYICGYKFPNNISSICRVCDDKAALYLVLKTNKIPCVEHLYFENSHSQMVEDEGIWTKLLKLFSKHKMLVCKANSGSGGSFVIKCETKKQLECAVFTILKSHRAMSVSPFIDIKNEYRIIVIDNVAKLIYKKQRPFVLGDGKTSLENLIKKKFYNTGIEVIKTLDFESVPQKDEEVVISWKHNLCQGSIPEIVTDKELFEQLSNFAISASRKIGLNFASVDIIDDGVCFKILEINSGVMMENFSRLSDENYLIAKDIYATAIDSVFIKNKLY